MDFYKENSVRFNEENKSMRVEWENGGKIPLTNGNFMLLSF